MDTMLKNKLESYRHVVWDWNGTLLADFEIGFDLFRVQLDRAGLPRLSVEEYRNRFKFPIEDFYKDAGFDFSKRSYKELSDEYLELYCERLPQAKLHGGVMELTQEVAESGKTQSILSAAEQVHLEKALHTFGIRDHFHHVFGVENFLGASKLARGRQLVAHVGIHPSETILIGDTDHDLEVGKALGVDVLLIADGHQSYEHLSSLHPQVIKTRY